MSIDRNALDSVRGGAGLRSTIIQQGLKWGERGLHGLHAGTLASDLYERFTGGGKQTTTTPAPAGASTTTSPQE